MTRGASTPGIHVAIPSTMPRISCSELLERGDLAFDQRDNETLARVARLLASRIGDPLAERCHDLARACEREAPVSAWKSLRAEITTRIAIAGS